MGKAPISRTTGLDVQPDPNLPNSVHAVYVPKLTTAQRGLIKAAELRNGAIIYNTNTRTYQVYQTTNPVGPVNEWINLNTSPATATGVGLTSGSPFILPSGLQAAVEVAANEVPGFTYYASDHKLIRTYDANAGGADNWVTVQIIAV